MMFVHADLFTNLFNRLASPATFESIDDRNLFSLVRGIGYLAFLSPSVAYILNTIVQVRQHDLEVNANLAKAWVEAVTNLRLQESDPKIRNQLVRLCELSQD